MCSRTLPLSLVALLLLLTAASSALAEPPAVLPYVNQKTGECGLFRDGFRDEERTPMDPDFGQLRVPWKPEKCKQLLDRVLAYPEELRTPSMDPLGEAGAKSPCERLASSLPASPEHACKALGYRYVGELPASIRPCYPNLAPFLGASCAPLIWIHLALLVAVLALLGVLGYVVLERRAQRRRAMAAAARDGAGPP